jgi:hypothetical protein
MLNVVPRPESPRSTEELVAQIHLRSSALVARRRRRRIFGIGGLGAAAVVVVAAVAVATPTGTGTKPAVASRQGPAQIAEKQAAFQALGNSPVNVEPPATPIGSGWQADVPSEPTVMTTTYSSWAALVTAALEDFEHVYFGGSSVALGSVQAQPDSSITFTRGPEGGKALSISTLTGTVSDPSGGTWRFSAAATPPSAGGSAVLQGDCVWVTTGSSTTDTATAIAQTGSCKNLVINLVGTTNRDDATVSSWQSAGGTRTVVNSPQP